MRGKVLVLSVLFSVLFLSGFAVAVSDVAYIMKNPSRQMAEENLMNAFDDLGLSVDMVSDKEAMTKNFSDYDVIFIGDDRLVSVNKRDFSGYNLVVLNRHYLKQLGFVSYGSGSILSANSQMQAMEDGKSIQVYSQAKDKWFRTLSYYYIDETKKMDDVETVVSLEQKSGRGKSGDVVSYYSGSLGENEVRKCFFGIVQSRYWTEDSERLFKDCLSFASGGDDEEDEENDEDDEENDEENDDNGEDNESDNHLGEKWMCEDDGAVRENCFAFSSGLMTRCYFDIEKDTWDTCSSGWKPVQDDTPIGENQSWFCEAENSTKDDCLSFSSGSKTRCYLNEEKTSWDSCSSGWVEV